MRIVYELLYECLHKNHENFVCRKTDDSDSKCILVTPLQPVNHKKINEFDIIHF